jgi:hypothetical protein
MKTAGVSNPGNPLIPLIPVQMGKDGIQNSEEDRRIKNRKRC